MALVLCCGASLSQTGAGSMNCEGRFLEFREMELRERLGDAVGNVYTSVLKKIAFPATILYTRVHVCRHVYTHIHTYG